MAAAVVELDTLADAVGPAAEDEDLLLALGGGCLVLGVVARVLVGRVGGELGGARVDALEVGLDAELLAARADGQGVLDAEGAGQLGVGEALGLELQPVLLGEGLELLGLDPLLDADDLGELEGGERGGEGGENGSMG